MKISTEKPPNWPDIEAKFHINFQQSGVLISYGDTVHVASGGISPDIRIHEQTHLDQQAKMGVEEWWRKYIADKHFRVEQEIEAYRNQVAYIKRYVSNRKKRELYITGIWKNMSEMYGDMISYQKAQEILPL